MDSVPQVPALCVGVFKSVRPPAKYLLYQHLLTQLFLIPGTSSIGTMPSPCIGSMLTSSNRTGPISLSSSNK